MNFMAHDCYFIKLHFLKKISTTHIFQIIIAYDNEYLSKICKVYKVKAKSLFSLFYLNSLKQRVLNLVYICSHIKIPRQYQMSTGHHSYTYYLVSSIQ